MVLKGLEYQNGEKELDKLIEDISNFLQHMGYKSFKRWLEIGSNNSKRCHECWAIINVELCEFVQDPKNRYSQLMDCIETQKKRLPPHCDFIPKLTELENFIKSSPTFSKEYKCYVVTRPHH